MLPIEGRNTARLENTIGRVVDAEVEPPKWLTAPPERARHKRADNVAGNGHVPR